MPTYLYDKRACWNIYRWLYKALLTDDLYPFSYQGIISLDAKHVHSL
jgi:hypothetical protein